MLYLPVMYVFFLFNNYFKPYSIQLTATCKLLTVGMDLREYFLVGKNWGRTQTEPHQKK